MAFDALTLSVLRQEWEKCLIGGKITKIYQPEKDELVLFVFNRQTFKLLISANANVNRIHLTDMPTDNPKTAPSFCMLLRKYITNAAITSVSQMPFERVVEFCLDVNDELGYKREMRLIFELTGKTSNIILTDGSYMVLDSIKHLPQDIDSARIIMPGAKYSFFAPQNKLIPFDLPRVKEFLSQCRLPLRKTLPEVLLGVSQNTVNEVLVGIDEDDHSEQNNLLVLNRLTLLKQNLEHPNPNVVLQNGSPMDVCPFDYLSKKGEKLFFDSLNKAHDRYFYLLDKAQRFADKAKSVSTIVKNAVSRTEKKLAAQRSTLLEAEEREKFRQFGDLILSNLHNVRDPNKLVCFNFYDNTEVTIPLDRQLSPQQNAQAYYKKYRKLRSSFEHNSRLVEENTKMLEYLLTIKQNLQFCTETEDLQQIREELALLGLVKEQGKKKTEAPVQPLKYNIEGYTVFVGKNNVQNNFVTFKLAKGNDVWLHTQKIHSSHVVIIAQNEVPPSVITKAAEICAYYSQARTGSKIAVDYTLRANVKKPNKAPLGFVVYNEYQTVIVNPDRHMNQLV